MYFRFILFLLINFAAPSIGSFFTTKGVASEWYQTLNKAPWTPTGWMFALAWTLIMIGFSFYMTFAYNLVSNRNLLIGLFISQWILNALWSPVFFKYQLVIWALVIIVLLTFLVGYFLFNYFSCLKLKSLFIAPYFLWLIIAAYLNLYIFLKN